MGFGLHGDDRLVRRCGLIADAIVRSGCVVVRKLAEDRAAEIATHRFLGSAQVTPAAILSDAAQRTAQACRGRRIVVAQDTTEINFAGAEQGRRGFGPAGNGKSPGFFIHALAAIDADDEAVLGIAGAQIWTRGPSAVTERQKRHLAEKESQRWIDGVATAGAVLAEAASLIVVGDRESDIYQVFTRRSETVDLVVRARADRRLAAGGSLFAAGAAFPIALEHDITVAPRQPRALGDTGRITRVAVSFGPVTIKKPKTGRPCADPRQTDLNLVVVREIDPPDPRHPVLWRLLTTLPVATAADALEITRLYRLRWRIEQVFRVLKRDGLALEQSQIETPDRLFNLAALAIGAAARIIQLTDARDASRRPATDVIDDTLIEAAAAIGKALEGRTDRQRNPHPVGTLSWLAWITARLGGWNCYYKPPGPKTMADGWRRLADRLSGYQTAASKSLL